MTTNHPERNVIRVVINFEFWNPIMLSGTDKAMYGIVTWMTNSPSYPFWSPNRIFGMDEALHFKSDVQIDADGSLRVHDTLYRNGMLSMSRDLFQLCKIIDCVSFAVLYRPTGNRWSGSTVAVVCHYKKAVLSQR